MRFLFLAVLVVFLLAVVALADVIHLKDGRKLEGRIVDENDSAVRLRMRYGEMVIQRNDIERIEKKPWGSKPEPKEEKPEPKEVPIEPEPPPREEPQEKPTRKVKVFTIDDFREFEAKFGSYDTLDEESKLRKLLEWKNDYKGRTVVIQAMAIAIKHTKTTVLTDEGEKPFTKYHVTAEYFNLKQSSNPRDRKRVWGGTAVSALTHEYDVAKYHAGPLKAGDTVYLNATFPNAGSPVGVTGAFFESVRLADLKGVEIEGIKRCDMCGGRGILDCSKCKGAGLLKCGICNSRGIVECKLCRGTGFNEVPRRHVCERCKGAGRHECLRCGGDGMVECHICDGKGHRTCPKCKGTGRK